MTDQFRAHFKYVAGLENTVAKLTAKVAELEAEVYRLENDLVSQLIEESKQDQD